MPYGVSEDRKRPVPWNDPDRRARRHRAQVRIATYVGLAFALVGSIDGIVLWAKSGPVTCFGRDFIECDAHPSAGEGLAILAISLGVGAAVLILSYIARNTERLIDRRPLDR